MERAVQKRNGAGICTDRVPAGSYKMSHTDPWCHATVSAAAYASGNAGSVPNTCYCPTGIQTFKQWGRWTGRQADTYNPQPGDIGPMSRFSTS